MRNIVLWLMITILAFTACQDESSAELGDASVFKRYFGSEFNHLPQQVLETSDGFIILCNIEIPTGTFGVVQHKIKLIKTDLLGNQQWSEVYPPFSEGDAKSLKGSSMIVTNGGYVIIGEEINEEDAAKPRALAILKTNFAGTLQDSSKISATNVGLTSASSLTGKAITLQGGSYIILGTISNTGASNTLFGSVDTTQLSLNWSQKIGTENITNVTNQVFYTAQQEIVWAYSTADINLTGFSENELGGGLFRTNNIASSNEIVSALCKTKGGFSGYVAVGTIDGGTTEDMYIVKFNPSGVDQVDFTTSVDFGLNDKGVSIAATAEGGTIALGTVDSNNDRGFGATDILAVRLDTQGEIIWQQNFGGTQNDEAASVIQTQDGGFLILGSTEFGAGFKKVTLIKVNSEGKLQ